MNHKIGLSRTIPAGRAVSALTMKMRVTHQRLLSYRAASSGVMFRRYSYSHLCPLSSAWRSSSARRCSGVYVRPRTILRASHDVMNRPTISVTMATAENCSGAGTKFSRLIQSRAGITAPKKNAMSNTNPINSSRYPGHTRPLRGASGSFKSRSLPLRFPYPYYLG